MSGKLYATVMYKCSDIRCVCVIEHGIETTGKIDLAIVYIRIDSFIFFLFNFALHPNYLRYLTCAGKAISTISKITCADKRSIRVIARRIEMAW